MSFHPPIAQGIILAFDDTLKDLYKLSFIWHMQKMQEGSPAEYKKVLHMYDEITENSTEDDCYKIVKVLKDIPVKEEYIAKCDKGTAIENFYHNFRNFRDLVEQKILLPLQEWKDMKLDSMYFSSMFEKLQEELDEIRRSTEKAKLPCDKEVSVKEAEEEHKRKIDMVTEDIKSLQPLFIMANSEEHMNRIASFKEKKLQILKDQLNLAEQNLQQAIKANKKEIEIIMEESIKTKSFLEWVGEKNYNTLKELEMKIKEEWAEFSTEMKNSRNLGNIYAEKHAIYLDIKRMEEEEERLGKQDWAATLIQAHWRGYKTRRMLKGDILF